MLLIVEISNDYYKHNYCHHFFSSVKDLSFGFISYVKATFSWAVKWLGFIALAYYTAIYFNLKISAEGTVESNFGKCIILKYLLAEM